ncbi:Putative Flp pilus-assembly TadE/G-like [Desulfoluna spongiiphila]|uniref:Putative Flp pilus-assembly TadE/G-like n=2 Tax=Desulfoluna spongiiphila TaxID=419481 RepID=A0A1G5HDJ6_9BACT|nr:Putative Flp pilus-assembly TadE/G-like [Desulfoluna spongiiphila]
MRMVIKTTINSPQDHEQGSIVLVVAFFMTALLMMLALVIESGYLFSEKRTLQNCVDAAAMAGALHLCDGDPEALARKVLVQNLFPEKEAMEDPAVDEDFPQNYEVEITRGYYDENDAYGDFLAYKEFAAEGDPDFPADEYVNAVKVALTVREALLMGELEKKKNVDVHVVSVAFRRRFGILAHGGNQGSDIRTDQKWRRNQLIFENTGGVHANSDIKCIEPVEVTGNTLVSAGGHIVNCRSGIQGASLVRDVRPIDWEYLNNNGTVYTVDQWPGHYGSNAADYAIPTEHGNSLYNHGNGKWPQYSFGLHEGDHQGRIYYFSDANAPANATLFLKSISNGRHYNAHNFTIASEIHIGFDGSFDSSSFSMGGENEKTVYIYCKKDIGGINYADKWSHLSYKVCKGIIFRTEKDFHLRIVSNENSTDFGRILYYFLNIIAEGSITFYGLNTHLVSNTYALNGTFGPPCSAAFLMHGRLELSDDKSR